MSNWEVTECYKCQSAVSAPKGAVHPLCDKCDESFQAWFKQVTDWEKQL